MIFIQKGRVIDPKTGTDAVMDLIIDKGKILAVGPGKAPECPARLLPGPTDQIINADGLVVAPGLIDVHVHFRDPGLT